MNGNQLLRFLPSVDIILWSYATIPCPLKNLMSVYYLLMVRCVWRAGDQDYVKNEAVRRLSYNTCLPTRWWAWRRRRKPGRGGGSRVPYYSRLVGGGWKPQDCSFYGDFSVPEGANCPPAWSAKWLQEGGTSYLPVWQAGWLALPCRRRTRGGFSVFWSFVASRKNFSIISWGKHNLQVFPRRKNLGENIQ